VPGQEIQSIIERHPGEKWDYVKADKDVLGADTECREFERSPLNSSHDVG
jgi:hypothetical protein